MGYDESWECSALNPPKEENTNVDPWQYTFDL